MVNNLKCDKCDFQGKCVAYNKMKPFLDTARTDLGVELTFNNCIDFASEDKDDEEDE